MKKIPTLLALLLSIYTLSAQQTIETQDSLSITERKDIEAAVDTVESWYWPNSDGTVSRFDSIRMKKRREVDFIVNQIDSVYIYGRRGISDEQWDKSVELIRQKVDTTTSWYSFYYALRYVGALINDSHFSFPDGGVYNRNNIFKKDDTIFPIWVKTWTDGSVYAVNDYENRVPKNSQIISVNGHSAKEMALINRSIFHGEKFSAMTPMNLTHEPHPTLWNTFTNYLFMEGIFAPFKVEYIAPNSTTIDTVTLSGIERYERRKILKKSGDQKKAIIRSGGNLQYYDKAIEYERLGETSTAVLTINSLWGRSLIELFIFGTDWAYPRQLKNVMARIHRQKIDTLIIDIRANGGGMPNNLYRTLNYFSDKPIDANSTYKVTDNNRDIMKRVISNSHNKLLGLSRDDAKEIASFVDSVKSGDSFSTDTLYNLQYRPDSTLKHQFKGKVFLITGPITYSAGQMFAQEFKRLDIGVTLGEPCGGYSSISGGNGQFVRNPLTGNWLRFMVPYSCTAEEQTRFEPDEVDIEIKDTFDEWLNDEDHTIEKALKIIRNSSH